MKNRIGWIDTLIGLATLFVFTVFVYDRFVAVRHIGTSPNFKAQVSPPTINIGDKLEIPGLDFANRPRNLVMLLSSTCHFCSESADFYRSMLKEAREINDLNVIAAFAHDVPTGKKYLDSLGLKGFAGDKRGYSSRQAIWYAYPIAYRFRRGCDKSVEGKVDSSEREGRKRYFGKTNVVDLTETSCGAY